MMNYYINFYLFLFIFFCMIIPLTFFKLGQGFNLNSNYVVFITTEGIIKYDPETQIETTIIDFGLSINEGEKYISFAQFPSDDNGYFFCRIKQYIYIFSENFEILGNFTDNDIAKSFVELVPFSKDGELNLISVFANEAQSLELKLYKFNYPNSSGNLLEFKSVNIQKAFKHDSNNNELVLNKRVSCEITYSTEYSREVLSCFLMNDQSLLLVINFYPENVSPISFSKNQIQTTGNNIIVSAVSFDKKKCIVCYIDFATNFHCSLYDAETNELSDPVILMTKCMQLEYGTDIQYISEKNEYIGYCFLAISKKNIIKFDENFEVKENENNSKYYISVSTQSGICYNVYSLSVLYIKSSHDYFIARTCDIDNVPKLDLISISEENIVKYDIPGDTKSEPTSTPNTKTTIPTPKTTLVLTTQIKTTIPTPTTTLVSTTQIKTTIPTLKSTLVSNIKSTITKTQPTLNIQTTTIIAQPLLLLSSEIQSSYFTSTKISNPISTYISNSIISKPSSIIITEQNIKTTYTKFTTSLSDKSTTLLVPNTPSMTIKNSILFSSLSSKSLSSTISSTTITKLSLPDSFISKSNIQSQSTMLTTYKKKLVFQVENDIMKAKINVTKEELDDHLDDIIDQVDIGKRYEINGDDYNITITSIDDIDDFKTTYADLSICEQILRKVNNISDDKILTMLQIEIDKLNSQSLTNQVEYVVYDEEKNQLDLSCCKNIPIKVTYQIKDGSALNQSMI